MEVVEQILSWVENLKSEEEYECNEEEEEEYEEPEEGQDQNEEQGGEAEGEQNEEQPAEEEGGRSRISSKHMKSAAAALGLGNAKEKIKGKISSVKEKLHHKDKVSK